MSTATADTVYSADAIEYHPLHSTIFACATYQIQTDTPTSNAPPAADDDNETDANPSPIVTRHGRCLLYETDSNGRNMCVSDRTGPALGRRSRADGQTRDCAPRRASHPRPQVVSSIQSEPETCPIYTLLTSLGFLVPGHQSHGMNDRSSRSQTPRVILTCSPTTTRRSVPQCTRSPYTDLNPLLHV